MKVILPELKAQGYEFVTVSELIADSKGSTSVKEVTPAPGDPLPQFGSAAYMRDNTSYV